jgi:hypothetical protein
MAALGEVFAVAVEEDDRCGGLALWCFVADGQGEVVFGFYADGFCTCFQFRVFEGFDLFQRIDKAALQPIERWRRSARSLSGGSRGLRA